MFSFTDSRPNPAHTSTGAVPSLLVRLLWLRADCDVFPVNLIPLSYCVSFYSALETGKPVCPQPFDGQEM